MIKAKERDLKSNLHDLRVWNPTAKAWKYLVDRGSILINSTFRKIFEENF